MATILRVASQRAIVIEEAEDEGDAYLFDLGDGTSLFLQGQEYDELTEVMAGEKAPVYVLPRQFDIVRTAVHGLWLGVANRQGTMRPELTVVAARDISLDFSVDASIETECVLPGNPREALARMGYAEPDTAG